MSPAARRLAALLWLVTTALVGFAWHAGAATHADAAIPADAMAPQAQAPTAPAP